MKKIPLSPLTSNKKVWVFMVGIFSILCGILYVLFYFQELFIVLLLGICLIALTDKASRIFNKYTGDFTRKQKYALALSLILVSVSIIVSMFLIQIGHVIDLFLTLPTLQDTINLGTALLLELMKILPDAVVNEIRLIIEGLLNQISLIVASMISQLVYCVLCMILLYPIMFSLYFKDQKRIKTGIKELIPAQIKNDFKKTALAILVQSNNYFTAKIIESLGIAIISCVGFYLLGLPGWLFLGIMAGLLNNVPYVGPIIASIPAILIGLAVGWKTALFVVAFCIVVQIIDNIYFIPFMISGKVRMNPLTTVLLILIFAQLFGPLGMILSIPIYMIFRIILTESYHFLTKIFPETTDVS